MSGQSGATPPKTDVEVMQRIMVRYAPHLLFLHRLYDLGPITIRACTPHLQGLAVPHERLLGVFMLNRATTSLASVTELFQLGLDADATSVGRTITELVIDYAWIFHSDTAARVERYFDYHTVMLHQIKTTFMNATTVRTPEETQLLDKLDADYIAAMAKWKYKRSGWGPKGVYARAKETGLDVLYAAFYVHGCNASHSNPHTLLQHAQGGTIWHGPRVPDMSLALQMAAKSFLMLVEKVVDQFGLSRTHVDAFNAEHLVAFAAP